MFLINFHLHASALLKLEIRMNGNQTLIANANVRKKIIQ